VLLAHARRMQNVAKEMHTQEGSRRNGCAASPRHFHQRSGPVYGLARTWSVAFPSLLRSVAESLEETLVTDPRSLTVAGAAQAFHLFPV